MKVAALILTGALAATAAYAQDPAQKEKPMTSADQMGQSVDGKVESYTAGKSITVKKADGSTATFTIPEKLIVTDNVVVGEKVTVRTSPSNAKLVESITVVKPPNP